MTWNLDAKTSSFGGLRVANPLGERRQPFRRLSVQTDLTWFHGVPHGHHSVRK